MVSTRSVCIVNASSTAGSVARLPLSLTLSSIFFSEAIIKYASNFPRKELLSFGTCFGRFTKTRKFRLHITALDFVAPYAKVRLKSANADRDRWFIRCLVQGLVEAQCRTTIPLRT